MFVLLGIAFVVAAYVAARLAGKQAVSALRSALAVVTLLFVVGKAAYAQVGTLTTNTFSGAVADANVIAQTHLSLFYQVLPILVAIGLILWLIRLMRTKAGK